MKQKSKIICIIHIYKVEKPTYMSAEPEMIRKALLQGYVASNLHITDFNDIQSITYMKGRTIMFSY